MTEEAASGMLFVISKKAKDTRKAGVFLLFATITLKNPAFCLLNTKYGKLFYLNWQPVPLRNPQCH